MVTGTLHTIMTVLAAHGEHQDPVLTTVTATALIVFAAAAWRSRGHPRTVTGTRTPRWTAAAQLTGGLAAQTGDIARRASTVVRDRTMAVAAPAVTLLGMTLLALGILRMTIWVIALYRHRRAWRPRSERPNLERVARRYGIGNLRTFDGHDPFRTDGEHQVRWDYHGRACQGTLLTHDSRVRLYGPDGTLLHPVEP